MHVNAVRHRRSRVTAVAAAGVFAATIAFVPTSSAKAATEVIQIDPGSKFQTVEGWGTSLAWWANILGGWSSTQKAAVEDLLFSPSSGLGLNIARYNIGAGINPDPLKNMRVGAEVPTFEPSNGVWDWTADANQRSILSDAQKRGVNVVQGFVNAPPAWMSKNACTAGAPDGSGNLDPSNYATYADYIAQITKHFRDSWGTNFRTVSPFNEPSAAWWKCSNNQEGNHVDVAEQAKIVDAVSAALKSQGLGTGVVAGENYTPALSLASWAAYPASTRSNVTQLNTHTYSGTSSDAQLRVAAREFGSRIWDSELGVGGTAPADHNDITSALQLAGSINTDLTQLQSDAFVYWQAVEDQSGNNNYGLLKANFTGTEEYWVTKQYYAMANYSRYVKAGSIVLQSNDGATLATWDPATNTLALVVHNDATTTRDLTYDLSKFASLGTQATRVETSAANNAAVVSPVTVSSNTLAATLPSQSITTFVLNGVTLPTSGTNMLTNSGFETGDLTSWSAEWNPSSAGVETTYPQSGTKDAFLHPSSTQDVGLAQTVTASQSGHVSITASAATSVLERVKIGVDVNGKQVDSRPVASNVGYRQYQLNADVNAGNTIKFWFYSPKSTGWATLDSTAETLTPTLLTNSGFENGSLSGWSADWNPTAVSFEKTFPFTGEYDGALNTTPAEDAGLSQTITAPRSGTYTLSASVASSTSSAQLGIDVGGVQKTTVNTGANTGYQTKTLTFSAIAGQSIKVWYYMPAVSGWATLDDVLLN